MCRLCRLPELALAVPGDWHQTGSASVLAVHGRICSLLCPPGAHARKPLPARGSSSWGERPADSSLRAFPFPADGGPLHCAQQKLSQGPLPWMSLWSEGWSQLLGVQTAGPGDRAGAHATGHISLGPLRACSQEGVGSRSRAAVRLPVGGRQDKASAELQLRAPAPQCPSASLRDVACHASSNVRLLVCKMTTDRQIPPGFTVPSDCLAQAQ